MQPNILETPASPSIRERPLAFLDSDVLLAYLQGKPPSAQLLDGDMQRAVRFASSDIVLQEILFSFQAVREHPEVVQRLRDQLTILPVDIKLAESLLPQARALRNRIAHSNDILIVSSAASCDFLVTYDAALQELEGGHKPEVVTPEQLITRLGLRAS